MFNSKIKRKNRSSKNHFCEFLLLLAIIMSRGSIVRVNEREQYDSYE